jgi:hypothetical protein
MPDTRIRVLRQNLVTLCMLFCFTLLNYTITREVYTVRVNDVTYGIIFSEQLRFGLFGLQATAIEFNAYSKVQYPNIMYYMTTPNLQEYVCIYVTTRSHLGMRILPSHGCSTYYLSHRHNKTVLACTGRGVLGSSTP